MSYLAQLGASANPVGTPPPSRNIGTPTPIPAAQPHIEPTPYDVAHDPAWRPFLNPHDHEMRNILNELSPEARMTLLKRFMAKPTPAGQIPYEPSPMPGPQMAPGAPMQPPQ